MTVAGKQKRRTETADSTTDDQNTHVMGLFKESATRALLRSCRRCVASMTRFDSSVT
jgi:hypothetical protein